jgi:hypothetical protein
MNDTQVEECLINWLEKRSLQFWPLFMRMTFLHIEREAIFTSWLAIRMTEEHQGGALSHASRQQMSTIVEKMSYESTKYLSL